MVDPTGAGDSFAGGFLGYLAESNDTSEAGLRKAIVYGSVVASFTVEDFSLRRLARPEPGYHRTALSPVRESDPILARRCRIAMDLSIVVPIYNEVDNLRPLCERVHAVLAPTDWSYELILIDDGSQDGSSELLAELHAEDETLKVLRFRRNLRPDRGLGRRI